MTVEINLPPVLQALADGVVKVDVSGSTVSECLAALAKKYPVLKPKLFNRRGDLPKGINIFINGENAYPHPLKRPVRSGDKLYIAYIVLGG